MKTKKRTQTKIEICPYVNGICEDLSKHKITGYCYIEKVNCKDATNFDDCKIYIRRNHCREVMSSE